MKKELLSKILVIGVVVLFIGACVVPGISGKHVISKDTKESTVTTIEVSNSATLSLHIFDKTGEKQREVVISTDAAYEINDMFEELKHKITHEPLSDETKALKIEFADLLDEHGLIPEGLSKEDVLSILNPYWLNARQRQNDNRLRIKAPVLRFILSSIFKNRINLRQLLKNWFGKTNFNSINNNPLIISSDQNVGTANYCIIWGEGEGVTLPIFVLPRPRVGALWFGDTWSETMVGEPFNEVGFWARGSQVGIALGFIGFGWTLIIEGGYVGFSFFGFAVYTRVIADEIVDF